MWLPCALLRDDPALGGALVEIADEVVRALLERGHPEAEGLARRDHFLDAEIVALELLGRRVLVGDDEDEGRARVTVISSGVKRWFSMVSGISGGSADRAGVPTAPTERIRAPTSTRRRSMV